MKLKTYSVRVSKGKNGQNVGTFEVKASTPDKARRAAIEAAASSMFGGDTTELHAHAPGRVGDKYSK